jgi:hypothetical protein
VRFGQSRRFIPLGLGFSKKKTKEAKRIIEREMRDINAFALLVWWYVCVREREIRRGLREAWPKKKTLGN